MPPKVGGAKAIESYSGWPDARGEVAWGSRQVREEFPVAAKRIEGRRVLSRRPSVRCHCSQIGDYEEEIRTPEGAHQPIFSQRLGLVRTAFGRVMPANGFALR